MLYVLYTVFLQVSQRKKNVSKKTIRKRKYIYSACTYVSTEKKNPHISGPMCAVQTVLVGNLDWVQLGSSSSLDKVS